MKIAICTIGSRGDIQPFLVLGQGLARHGHTVKVSSATMYTELAQAYEVEYVPFAGDYHSLVDNEEMKKTIGRNPFTLRKKLKEKVYPVLESSLKTFFELAQWADVVVYHPKALVDAFGYLFPEKLVKAYVVPAFTPTKAFPSPVLSGLPIPSFLNRFSFRITNALISTVKGPIQSFYTKHGLSRPFRLLDTPVLYGISPSFLPRPADYPPHQHFTGFWLDDQSKQEVDEPVRSFLDTPRRKLIITFGSMPYKSKIPVNELIAALQHQMDVKVLVVRGWGLKDALIEQVPDVLAVEHAPFDKLFPLADAVVHHGGAGTTAVALKAGVPMMICPVLHPVGDQMFWGEQATKAGVGVKSIPLAKLTVRNFVESVEQLFKPVLTLAAQRLQKKIAAENGVEVAVMLLEKKERV